jgi:hypothetical protein
MPGGMRGLEGIGVMAGPIGLIATTLIGVGIAAGVASVAAFRGMVSGARGVTDRRRFAMGIGSGYGEVAGFDLDFARFGADQGTLGSVASGLYDVTSPQRIGLMTAGVTGGKDAVATAVELIRKIPQMLKGVDDGAVGPVAKSMGLTDILDLPTIVRLKNHPEEIEDQVKKFQGDKITLDMSAKATEAWASFTAEIERDGMKIETALGKGLVGLTPGLTHLSEEMVDIVGNLIKSEDGLKGAESGLERLGGYLGSDKFKGDEDRFLSGLKALDQYGTVIVGAGLAAGVVGLGLGGGLTGLVLGILKKYPGILLAVMADSALRSKFRGIITGKDGREYLNPGPPLFGGGGSGGGGSTRARTYDPTTGHVVDAPTPGSYPPVSAPGTPQALYDTIRAKFPHLTNEQCVALVDAYSGIHGTVREWRRGDSVTAGLPIGTPVATFLDRSGNQSELYDGGQGVGAPGNNTTHTAILSGTDKTGIWVTEQYTGSGGPQLHHYLYGDSRGGEKDALNYHAIVDSQGVPMGTNNPYREQFLRHRDLMDPFDPRADLSMKGLLPLPQGNLTARQAVISSTTWLRLRRSRSRSKTTRPEWSSLVLHRCNCDARRILCARRRILAHRGTIWRGQREDPSRGFSPQQRHLHSRRQRSGRLLLDNGPAPGKQE